MEVACGFPEGRRGGRRARTSRGWSRRGFNQGGRKHMCPFGCDPDLDDLARMRFLIWIQRLFDSRSGPPPPRPA